MEFERVAERSHYRIEGRIQVSQRNGGKWYGSAGGRRAAAGNVAVSFCAGCCYIQMLIYSKEKIRHFVRTRGGRAGFSPLVK
ncbi:hypothetical protein V6N12_056454 [Hibiscus sabdariffa]|uniref:Uncharacterized protein n=1 Tax=Hibiscus sabdariffa TaxID=183260 RepID=A0ABR2CSK8_9ROSI